VEARDEYLPTTSRDVPGWFGLLRSQARQSPQYGSPTQSSEDGRSKDSPHARPASADRSGSRPQITIRNASEGLSKTTGFSPAGNEALILLASHQGLVHPCFSEDILEEYAAVLARAKFAFPPDEIAAVLAMFHNQGELFSAGRLGARFFRPGRHEISALRAGRTGRLHRHRQQASFSGRALWRDSSLECR
jgi:hypothetical protein